MTDYDSMDFFMDESLVEDPYPYFEHLRSKCPVLHTESHGVVAVSGYEEASEIYLDNKTFSSCNSVIGPSPLSRCRSRETTWAGSSTATAISSR